MTKFSTALLLLAFVGHAAAAVNLCGCFCSNSATGFPGWGNLLGGTVTTSGSTACTTSFCNTNYQATTQCAANSFNYVIAEYQANISPDATFSLTSTSGCSVGSSQITVGGTDCNSQCFAGFDGGVIDNNDAVLISTYSGNTCVCPVGEITTGGSPGSGTGVIVTPSPTDPNINFAWAGSSSGTYVMTAGSCTLTYAVTIPTSSPANIIKPAAGFVVAAIVAASL